MTKSKRIHFSAFKRERTVNIILFNLDAIGCWYSTIELYHLGYN